MTGLAGDDGRAVRPNVAFLLVGIGHSPFVAPGLYREILAARVKNPRQNPPRRRRILGSRIAGTRYTHPCIDAQMGTRCLAPRLRTRTRYGRHRIEYAILESAA